MSDRRCPRCQATYPPPARYCVKDGSPLVDEGGQRVGATRAAAEAHAAVLNLPASPAAFAATLTGQTLDQRYQIGQRLGEGGMSYVYRAHDRETDQPVAVKILIPRLSRYPASVE
ncbi:MAG: hypothetical protein ACR2HK_06905, partial [Gemmatimonadales bacterium]